MAVTCPRCCDPVGDADNFCHACGWALDDVEGDALTAPARALVPDEVRSETAGMSLLPAVRADLAPLAPVVRSAAAVLATAALTDWAARRGAPALARKTREIVQGKPQQQVTQTVMIERRVTVRQWVSVRS